MSDAVAKAFEALEALGTNERAFLRNVLLRALKTPVVARNPSLPGHLMMLPALLRGELDVVPALLNGELDVDLMRALSLIAHADAPYLASFLAGHAPEPFI